MFQEIKKIKYDELNSFQKEAFNYHKFAARLAGYGFNCLWLREKISRSEFLAVHPDVDIKRADFIAFNVF